MKRRLRLGIAQINSTVGDFEGNFGKIRNAFVEARAQAVDILTLPEMVICGYPPEDLLFKEKFINQNRKTLERLAVESTGLNAIVGFVDRGAEGELYNAAAILSNGQIISVYHKISLPNYGVFDEKRYFKPGGKASLYSIGGIKVRVNICEDIWEEESILYEQEKDGAELMINISASPYHYDKWTERKKMLSRLALTNKIYIIYNNLVGGQDELVFDGCSMAFDKNGELLTRCKQLAEDFVALDIDVEDGDKTSVKQSPVIKLFENVSPLAKPPLIEKEEVELSLPAEIYEALVLGTHDYIVKNGFRKIVVGLSGGIDSSIVATIATDALGKENVVGVIMSSRYTSEASVKDAVALAENLGIEKMAISIEEPFEAYLNVLKRPFTGKRTDTTEENIQARIRGNILMALCNKFGWLVLATGNKSEMATGFTTLYGDLAGGFAVIKDVPKTMVYELAEYRNSIAGKSIIPQSILDKPPSAELRHNQKDEDNLPPYSVLDPILVAYVEDDKSVEEIIEMGFDKEVVKKVARLVDLSEYKRRQAPPGVKITPKAFGRDRRLPITNAFK
jgi:NAD+ synthase (glutamine-hydrolysing)